MQYHITPLPKRPAFMTGDLVRTSGIIGIITRIDKSCAHVTALTPYVSKEMTITVGQPIIVDKDALSHFNDAITLQN